MFDRLCNAVLLHLKRRPGAFLTVIVGPSPITRSWWGLRMHHWIFTEQETWKMLLRSQPFLPWKQAFVLLQSMADKDMTMLVKMISDKATCWLLRELSSKLEWFERCCVAKQWESVLFSDALDAQAMQLMLCRCFLGPVWLLRSLSENWIDVYLEQLARIGRVLWGSKSCHMVTFWYGA